MKSQKQAAYDPAAVLAALANSYTSNDDDAQVTLFDGPGPWVQVAINNAILLSGWLVIRLFCGCHQRFLVRLL